MPSQLFTVKVVNIFWFFLEKNDKGDNDINPEWDLTETYFYEKPSYQIARLKPQITSGLSLTRVLCSSSSAQLHVHNCIPHLGISVGENSTRFCFTFCTFKNYVFQKNLKNFILRTFSFIMSLQMLISSTESRTNWNEPFKYV